MEINREKGSLNIDYIIAEIINGNLENVTDTEIENYIKLFCLNKIQDYYSDYKVNIVDKKSSKTLFSFKNANGLTKEKNIFLKKKKVLAIKNKNLDIIRTIMHEVEHVKQIYMLEHNDISYTSYLILRDEIISYKLENNYYKDNYEYIYSELDARLNAELELFVFLSNYCPDLLDLEIDNIVENILQYEKNSQISYRIINGMKYDTEELFDTIIKNNSYLVKECPLLNLYYNQDGSKILLGELIRRSTLNYNNKKDSLLIEKVKKLDSFIIKNRRGSKENLMKDIDSILKINDKDNNEIVLMLNDRIKNYNTNDLSLIYNLLQINSIIKSKIATNSVLVNK